MSVPLAVGVAYGRKKQQNNSTRRSNRRDLTGTSRNQGDSRYSTDESSIFCNSSWPLRKLIVCSVVFCAGLNAVKQVTMFYSRLPSSQSTPASPPPLHQDSALRGSRREDSQHENQADPQLNFDGDHAWAPSVGSLPRELEATDSSRLSGISIETNSPPLPVLPPLSTPLELDNQAPPLPHLPPLEKYIATSPFASASTRESPPHLDVDTTTIAAPSTKTDTLLSAGKPARSDVRGNLGQASVITSEVVKDWLKDRWQAAKNMKGEPIPGRHWLEVDLGRPCSVSRFLVDWETAHAKDYAIEGWLASSNSHNIGEWITLADASHPRANLKTLSSAAQHVVHTLSASTPPSENSGPGLVSKVKLLIRRPATRWGVSVWRFQVWGNCNEER